MKELQKKLKENPDKAIEILDEFFEITFKVYFFRAQVYLDTEYAINYFTIIVAEDESQYQTLLKMEIENQEDMKQTLEIQISQIPPGWIKDYTSYFKTLEDYIKQLESKVISDQN